MNMQSKPTRNQSAIWRELDGETAIISSDAGKLHMLNEVAGRIWTLLDGEKDLQTIVNKVAEEFDEDCDIVTRDALEFLTGMHSLDLVRD